ncbi:hypothetical protein AAW51_0640 [Caldimonas brevitalea]|uniref:Uncharacterized protein n=1 Tax=Caldimonas brevitalea TaxID=413882 RepID=A0A0G3BIZ2_9BURK|nr:hypothetical protein AAW51_0640 [Caldimonas brevitalea]
MTAAAQALPLGTLDHAAPWSGRGAGRDRVASVVRGV